VYFAARFRDQPEQTTGPGSQSETDGDRGVCRSAPRASSRGVAGNEAPQRAPAPGLSVEPPLGSRLYWRH